MRNRIPGTIRHFLLLLMASTVSFTAQGQEYKYHEIYSFQNNGTDPSRPTSLIIDPGGNLYGTSFYGGKDNVGTVFKLTQQGVLTELYSFNADTGGESPSSLVRDSKGNLYGATPFIRGNFDYNSTFFRLTPETSGGYAFHTLWAGSWISPVGIAIDPSKNIYGVINPYSGGSYGSCGSCLFKLGGGSQWTDLWDFAYTNFNPLGNVVIDKSGNVYGTIGGDGGSSSWGYVFKWSPTSGYSVIHSFDGTDGEYPNGLALDGLGNLYGTTSIGGLNGTGTVFEITMGGAFSTLYNFCMLPGCVDGAEPSGAITLDAAGNVYGTTYYYNGVFKIKPGVGEKMIYAPPLGVGGYLTIDKAGNLYGVDSGIFELTPAK
jgi:uncharacterized repeat protein (TIGR03803 family)